MIWQGKVQDGQGQCFPRRLFPAGWYQGSLNLWPVDGVQLHDWVRDARPPKWETVEWMPVIFPIRLPDLGVDAVMGLDFITGVHEVVARQHLRSAHKLTNGSVVTVSFSDDLLVAHGNQMG